MPGARCLGVSCRCVSQKCSICQVDNGVGRLERRLSHVERRCRKICRVRRTVLVSCEDPLRLDEREIVKKCWGSRGLFQGRLWLVLPRPRLLGWDTSPNLLSAEVFTGCLTNDPPIWGGRLQEARPGRGRSLRAALQQLENWEASRGGELPDPATQMTGRTYTVLCCCRGLLVACLDTRQM